eukprot:1143825-Pelagomonas_calceolata.AAC.1
MRLAILTEVLGVLKGTPATCARDACQLFKTNAAVRNDLRSLLVARFRACTCKQREEPKQCLLDNSNSALPSMTNEDAWQNHPNAFTLGAVACSCATEPTQNCWRSPFRKTPRSGTPVQT